MAERARRASKAVGSLVKGVRSSKSPEERASKNNSWATAGVGPGSQIVGKGDLGKRQGLPVHPNQGTITVRGQAEAIRGHRTGRQQGKK